MSACIQDYCGAPYDINAPETRDPFTLKPFWWYYCPAHRVPAKPPVIITAQEAD